MTPRAVRAALTGFGVAIALVVAWLVPATAIVVIWPLLLVVPGWVVLAVARPRIDAAGRAGLAIVITTAVATHLVFWLSQLAGSYGRGTIFAAVAILALPLPIAAWRGAGLTPRRIGWRGPAGALMVAVAAALVVGATLGVGMWRVDAFGVTSGGSNWSDLGVHLSIAETLNAGANFPPEVPYFAGAPLVYHWFADFHAAILAEAAGVFSVPAMVVQSALLSGALALIVFSLTRRLLRGRDARRTATLAAALAVLGGGFGYVRFIGDLTAGLGSPLELIARHSYDNQWLTDWPYFRIPSVMGTGLLAHRATTAGLPMLAGALLLFIAGLPTARARLAGWRDRPMVILLAGILGALLAPFHFFFFPVVPLLALAWAAASGRLRDAPTLRHAGIFLAPYALAVPFAVAPLFQAAGSGALRLVPGWPSAPFADGPAAVAFFFLTNLGVPFALTLVALLTPRLPHRAFLAAWVVGLFLIPNVVQVSVVDFDMNKYFQAMWLTVGLLAAWLLREARWPVVAAVLALSLPSPLLAAAWTATSNLQVLSTADLAASRWVAENTPSDAVFVTDGWVNSLTDAAGRRRLTTFGPYIANLGYSPDERVAEVFSIYCGGDAGASAQTMRRLGATYLVDAGRPEGCIDQVAFAGSPAFELVYDAGPLIWRLTD